MQYDNEALAMRDTLVSYLGQLPEQAERDLVEIIRDAAAVHEELAVCRPRPYPYSYACSDAALALCVAVKDLRGELATAAPIRTARLGCGSCRQMRSPGWPDTRPDRPESSRAARRLQRVVRRKS